MKYFYLFIFCTTLATAQVGIGTVTPNAALDVTSANDGLLIPRVALTSLVIQAPVTASNSEMVYNTATVILPPVAGLNNSVTPGYYYWTPTPARWNRLDNTIKSGVPAASAAAVPSVVIPGALGTPVVQTPNTTTEVFGELAPATITRTITVSGFVGNVGVLTCNVQFGQNDFNSDVNIYLESPTGQRIQLTNGNGGGIFVSTNNITFSDAAALNVTSWTTGSLVGTFRPQGGLFGVPVVPNITTMAGFNGFNPNGIWTLTVEDDNGSGNDFTTFNSFNLTITPTTDALYRLVAQSNLSFKGANNVVVSSSYSANTVDNEGYVTAITRVPVAPTFALGATQALPAGTIVSYVSDSPRQGAGNFWASSANQAVISSGLADGTTYTFQLWVKANVDTPTVSNEQFSLIPMMIPQ
jgi:subtilisin-like proprotein convertase family protein